MKVDLDIAELRDQFTKYCDNCNAGAVYSAVYKDVTYKTKKGEVKTRKVDTHRREQVICPECKGKCTILSFEGKKFVEMIKEVTALYEDQCKEK